MKWQYGAVVGGRRSAADASSTVEARDVLGGRAILLAAVQGDLATPSLESLKAAFARLKSVDEDSAAKLLAAAPPPPYAAGVAVVLVHGGRARLAVSGTARAYRERAHALEELGAGAHELRVGDAVIAASHASLAVGRAFFSDDVANAPAIDETTELCNSALDAALDEALSRGDGGFVAVAASRLQGL